VAQPSTSGSEFGGRAHGGPPGIESLFSIMGDGFQVLRPKRIASDDSSGGGDIDCVVFGLDRAWPLRAPGRVSITNCLNYDITAWYWIVDIDGEVVALDILDDPCGLGKYGFPTERLRNQPTEAGSSAVRAAYLASKRIYKGDLSPGAWEHISDMARSDPGTYQTVLTAIFGKALAKHLAALAHGNLSPSKSVAVRARRTQQFRRFRTLPRLIKIAFLSIRRVYKRLIEPTGLVVTIVGPDGTGKSTLVKGLVTATESLFRTTTTIHWRPGLLPRPGRLVGKALPDATSPHSRPPHGALASYALLTYFWTDFFLGGWLSTSLYRLRSGLVLVERGWDDIAVDSRRYRIRVRKGSVHFLGRFLPKPDVVLALEGSTLALLERKSEISASEMNRQMALWRSEATRGNYWFLDVEHSPDEVAAKARATLVNFLETRAISRVGQGWINIQESGSPRWVIPRGRGRASSSCLFLYQPVTAKSRAVWRLAYLAARLGMLNLVPRGSPPSKEVREILAPHLSPGGRFALMRSTHPSRYVAWLVDRNGQAEAVAKIALDPDGKAALAAEALSLERLSHHLPAPIRSPRVLFKDDGLIVSEPIKWTMRKRPWYLDEELAFALGRFYGAAQSREKGFSHGDFAPWNLLKCGSEWVLIDWENGGVSGPFQDPFHFLVQGHILLGQPSRDEIYKGLNGIGWVGAALKSYAEGANLPAEFAQAGLERYLLSPPPDGKSGSPYELRARHSLLEGLTSGAT
jgi:hypothetical protein